MKSLKTRHPKIVFIRYGILFICLCSLTASPAPASDTAEIKEFILSQQNDQLSGSLSIEGAFGEKTSQTILSGVPVSFSLYVRLHRIRNLWFDKKIADIKVTHTIKYHPLKKEFTVVRSWENSKPHMTRSLEEAQRLMTEVRGLKIIPLAILTKDTPYKISAKAKMDNIKRSFYTRYILFFIPLSDFETDWYTVNFIH